ncbi:MAG: hypothetical protein WCI56_01515 [Hyphomicrobiales bacterium]
MASTGKNGLEKFLAVFSPAAIARMGMTAVASGEKHSRRTGWNSEVPSPRSIERHP